MAANVEIRDSPGRGQGLFATRNIALGENILQETPIHEFDDRTLQHFAGYDARLEPAARLGQVLQRSGLPIGGGNFGLFPTACKINHSCRPNANNHWNINGALNIQALVDIHEGDEITIAYIGTEHWNERPQILMDSWDFVCTCPSCAVGDRRRDAAVGLAAHLKDKIVRELMHDHAASEHTLSTWIGLICSHLELRAELPGALYDAFQFACANQDRGAAEHYMALKLTYAALFHGEHNDSIPTFQALNRDPANHMIWGRAFYPPSAVERLDVEAMIGF